jgi:Cellulose binding domain
MLARLRWNAFGCATLLATTIGLTVAVSAAHAGAPEHGAPEHGAPEHGAPEHGLPMSQADTVPPTKPGLVVALEVSLRAAIVNVLSPSSDNTGVAGYVVQRQIDGVWTDVATNNITTLYVRDLAPATTYTIVAVAFDPAGNRSPQSDPVTFTTRSVEPAPTCQSKLVVFGTGYLAYVTVENMTLTPLPGWFVTFTLPTSHTVFTVANATLVRTGDQARLNAPPWFTTVFSGGRITIVINAARPTSDPLPSDFRLNGTTQCSIAP